MALFSRPRTPDRSFSWERPGANPPRPRGVAAGSGWSFDSRGKPQRITGGGGGSSSGSANSSLKALIDALTKGQSDANAANLKLYEEMEALAKENLEGIDAATAQRAADIGQQFMGLQSRTGQDLVFRGLSASTVQPTVMAGIQAEREGALSRNALAGEEAKRGARLDLAGMKERRVDRDPTKDYLGIILQMLANQ